MSFAIKARISFQGTHFWPNAPERVDYLKNNHRHIFTALLTKNVKHTDRDFEFICLKNDVLNFLNKNYVCNDNIFQFGCMSCEAIAEVLGIQFDCVQVEVWEDMENAGVWINDHL